MKIGFDAKRLFNNFTGLGNYSRFVVKALVDHFPDEEYLLYSPKIKLTPETDFFRNAKRVEVRTPDGIYSAAKSLWRSIALGNVASREGAALFHGLSNELPMTKPEGLKTIVSIHDVIYRRYPEFYKPIDRKIYDWKFRRACASADKIIAVSHQTANDVQEFLRGDAGKIEVVYQGCHPIFKAAYTDGQVAAIRTKYKLPEAFILMVGTIEYRKNALVLLQALARLSTKMPVVIVGRATAYQAVLDDFIRKNNLSKFVTFIHNAGFLELPLIYHAAKVFVYPSLFEGFGIPIVEAIACDLPVITSTGSCFSEAGGPDCRYVDPRNAEEVATVIEQTLSDHQATQARIRNTKVYIQRFEPGVIAGDMMKIYRQLV